MTNTPNINYSQTESASLYGSEGSEISLNEESFKLFATSDLSFEEQFNGLTSLKNGQNNSEEITNTAPEPEFSETMNEAESLGDFAKVFENEDESEELNQIDAEKVFRELGQQAKLIQELQKQLDSNPQFQHDKAANSKLAEIINSLKDSSRGIPNDPQMFLDKQNLKLTMNFPMLNDLKSVQVQYDPVARSIVAEMVTSQEAARILQNQVAVLERNLAKHDIKLQSLKIIGTEGNSSNQEKQDNQENQRQGQKKQSKNN